MTIQLARAQTLLEGFPRQRILVVGDLMLDRYIYGSVSRISPEAPVPVVQVTREKSVPGGASNVAWNVQQLRGQAVVGGILGVDDAGRELRAVLERGGVSVDGALALPEVPTTVKTRIIAERQQVVRVDWDHALHATPAVRTEFCELLRAEVRRATGVIIEDYSKGVVQQAVIDAVLDAARTARIPVGLDPKDNRALKFPWITVATPNRKEAFTLAGREDPRPACPPLEDAALLEVGAFLLEEWHPQLLAITLGPQGMLLLAPDAAPRHVPTRAREVYDVSGAGDTVIATCVLALAAGASHYEALELANYAAGVVVGKLGTATCTPPELLAYLAEEGR